VVYALRRPDPVPAVFGYHELFHALTIVGVACQYVAIAFFIVRAG
jgi:hemolysin III